MTFDWGASVKMFLGTEPTAREMRVLEFASSLLSFWSLLYDHAVIACIKNLFVAVPPLQR